MQVHSDSVFEFFASEGISVKYKAIRHDLHMHPETAFEEDRTSDVVAGHLQSLGIEVHRGLAGTGVVGTITRGASDKKIALRADMDALDMQEENEFAHKSTIDGKMHGCGHDGHTTMLLAAAEYLVSDACEFDGTVYLIFQPAEENEGGGERMVKEGLFDMFPAEAVFGMHNIPGIPVGDFAVKAGPMMAGFDVFDIEIEGNGGHAAMPHFSSDPLVAAATILTSLQSIVSRNVDPMKSAVVSVTQIHGGSTYNVIPGSACLAGTVRYFDPLVQDMIEKRMEEVVKNIAEAHGVTATFTYQRRYPATINTEAEATICADVLQDAFGADKVDLSPTPLMGAEDFAFLLQAAPGCYIWAGNGDGEGSCMVHNPKYDFNDSIIPYGATYWVKIVEKTLS